jgi:plasmid stabilization system protein ParE
VAREVVWTPEAQEDYRTIVSYLIDQFGHDVAETYTDKLFDVIETLRKMPYIGRAHVEFSALRQQLVRPYTKISYVVVPDLLIIVNLKDSRSGNTSNR